MYRPVRRADRQISEAEARVLLVSGEYGVLSTVSPDGQPYATPLSYVVIDNHICFHGALTGQKTDNLTAEPRACFCVVGQTKPVYEDTFSTLYESVLVYGDVSFVEEPEEKKSVLMALGVKYMPSFADRAPGDATAWSDKTCVFKMRIDHITGKAKRQKPHLPAMPD